MWRTSITCVCLVGFAACAGPNAVDEQPALSTLAPIEQPVWQAGMTAHQVEASTGKKRSWTIVEVSEGIVAGRADDGCTWTNRADWFTPALSWDNCGTNRNWNKGVRTITEETGKLWPLKVGNKATYRHSYETLVTGEKDSAVRTCEVESTVRISVAAGDVDAYKVVCTDQRKSSSTVRTWYWTPDRGQVKFMRWHSRRGLEENVDMVDFETPDA